MGRQLLNPGVLGLMVYAALVWLNKNGGPIEIGIGLLWAYAAIVFEWREKKRQKREIESLIDMLGQQEPAAVRAKKASEEQ